MVKQSIEKGRQGKDIKIISFYCNCLEKDFFGNFIFENIIFFGPAKKSEVPYRIVEKKLYRKLKRKVALITTSTDAHRNST
jgi:hypothetical protein